MHTRPLLILFPWLSVLDWLASLIVYSIEFRSVHGLVFLGVYIINQSKTDEVMMTCIADTTVNYTPHINCGRLPPWVFLFYYHLRHRLVLGIPDFVSV